MVAARLSPLASQPRLLLAVAAIAAVVWVPLVATEPAAAFALPFAAVAVAALVRLDPRYPIAAVLAFIPVQELVVGYTSGPALFAARYGPELVLDLLALVVVATSSRRIWQRLGPAAVPLVALLSFWALTGVWNAVAPSTVLVGLRSELRFLPLVVLPLVSRRPLADARLYGRVLVYSGAVQAVIALAELAGGERVRSALAPRYEIVFGGVSLGKSGPPLDTVFGTFGNRNLLGIFLALAWIVLAAAGSRGLGIRPRAAVLLGWLIVGGVVASGSREGALALLVGLAVIGAARWGRSFARLGLAAAAGLVVVGLWLAPVGDPGLSLLDSASIHERWRAVFTPVAWSPDTNFRLRLLVENTKLTAAEEPFFGFGIGTASDPRRLANFTSPVYRSFPGLERAVLPFLSDGNWAILVLEVGFVGLALLALVLLALVQLGLEVRERHWSGLALAAVVPAVLLLGLFTSVLQQRPASALLWLLGGLVLAVRSAALSPS